MGIQDVKLVRLISGEELMGEAENVEGGLFVKNICQVAATYSDPTSATARIGLAPFIPYGNVKDGVLIRESYIGFVVDPVNELLNEYNKIFGSGIVMASEGQIQSVAKAGKTSGNHAFMKL